MLFVFLYISLFLLALIGYNKTDKYKDYVLLTMWVIITLFQGLRWNTGADWRQYLVTFEDATWGNIFSYTRGIAYKEMEFGYMFLNILIKTIFSHYTFFLLLTCGFMNYSYLKNVRDFIPQKFQTFAFAMFIVSTSLFPVRQALACSIFFCLGIKSLIERNFRIYFLVVFLSYSIHYSCIVLIPFYWLNRRVNVYVLLGMYLGVSLMADYIPSIMTLLLYIPGLADTGVGQLLANYSQFTEIVVEHAGFVSKGFSIFLPIVFIIAFDYLRRNYKHFYPKVPFDLLLNMYVISVVGRQLSMLPGMSEFARLGYYTAIAFPILISLVVFTIIHLREDVKYIFLSVFMLFFLYKGFSIFRDPYSHLMVPYYSVFEQSPIRDSWYR